MCHSGQYSRLLQAVHCLVNAADSCWSAATGTAAPLYPQTLVLHQLHSRACFQHATHPAYIHGLTWTFLCYRNESVVFIEALAALDAAPSSLLLWPEHSKARSLDSALVRFNDAVRAMAVHVYGHASAALARCVRTAAMYLGARPWLALQRRSKAGSGASKGSAVQAADMEATRDTLKQVRAGLAPLCAPSVFLLASTGHTLSKHCCIMQSHSRLICCTYKRLPAAVGCCCPGVLLCVQGTSTRLLLLLLSVSCAVSGCAAASPISSQAFEGSRCSSKGAQGAGRPGRQQSSGTC
jgi:hypothetical protein